MNTYLISTLCWCIWSCSGLFILGYSIYLKEGLLIFVSGINVASGINVGLNFTILVLNSWWANIEDYLIEQTEEYDTEFDYEPGYDFTQRHNYLYIRNGSY